MWTETTRHQYRREDLRYASDMTDADWALIEPHMPTQKQLGRPRKVQLREVVGALLYILRTACRWRLLPHDFPKRSSVQHYFYAWQKVTHGRKRGCGSGSISFSCKLPANARVAKPALRPGSSIASRSRPPKAAVRAVRMRAKRSRGASATSSPTPAAIWLAPRCTPPTSRTATGRWGCWLQSAISSPGCVPSLPTALTLARSWKPLLPGAGGGPLKSSSDQIRPRVLKSCQRRWVVERTMPSAFPQQAEYRAAHAALTAAAAV
jgi:hypothetical protein